MRKGAWAYGAAALLGFLLAAARLNAVPGDLSARAPEQERLAALIRVEQKRSARLRTSAEALRQRVQDFDRARGRSEGAGRPA